MSRTYAPLALVILIAACDPGSKYDYSKCGDPVSIDVLNEDVLDGNALALPKGVETDIVLRVLDAEGDLCDPAGLELAFDDASQIEIVGGGGEDTVLKPLFDAIDRGAEPTTVMHASLGDLHASWTVASVVALGGTWSVTITEYTRYPEGYDFGEVIFTQLGRRMVWKDCILSLVCERDAVIVGASFTVEAPDYDLSIAVPIDPDRNRFAGPWSTSDGKYEGDFTAVRIE